MKLGSTISNFSKLKIRLKKLFDLFTKGHSFPQSAELILILLLMKYYKLLVDYELLDKKLEFYNELFKSL